MKTSRLYNLDYLRGIAALSIMIYHYAGFAYEVQFSPDDFMQKIGIYGVSVFYVLSGLTLFHVYSGNMKPNRDDIIDFFLKRGFRIMPLLWLIFLAYIFIWGWPGIEILFLNMTGLFGLIAPSKYFGTGVWSIGNELVFYLFFPLFMFLFHKSKFGLAILSFVLLAGYCYFAYYVFPVFGKFHAGAWAAYVNPLNQVFLFLSGYIAGLLLKGRDIKIIIMVPVLLTSLVVFAFYPVQGTDVLPLMTGNVRMLYTFLSVIVCLSAYKISYKFPVVLDKPLRLLGEISYSLYLLHPVLWFTIDLLSDQYYILPVHLKLVLSVVGTFVASYLSYTYFEIYFIGIGRKVSKKLLYRHERVVVQ